MASLLKRILLTLIGLAVLVLVERSFGMTTAMVATGICFLLYVLWITIRQMRDEDDAG